MQEMLHGAFIFLLLFAGALTTANSFEKSKFATPVKITLNPIPRI